MAGLPVAIVLGGPNNAPKRSYVYPSNAAVPFQHLATLFEKSSGSSGHVYTGKQRQKLLEEFMDRYINRDSDDTFQIMRLLCPEVGRQAGSDAKPNCMTAESAL
jgi:hypothetical protein